MKRIAKGSVLRKEKKVDNRHSKLPHQPLAAFLAIFSQFYARSACLSHDIVCAYGRTEMIECCAIRMQTNSSYDSP